MPELWLPVREYEGLYEVSDHGRVRGPKGDVKPKPTNSGYHRTEFWRKGQRRRPSLHRVVAQTFVANPDEKPQVNHLDGNKLNNKASNLEWCTASENMIHAVMLHNRTGENVSTSKLKSDEVIAIRVLLTKGVPGQWIADLFCITNAQISHIKNNQHWKNQ